MPHCPCHLNKRPARLVGETICRKIVLIPTGTPNSITKLARIIHNSPRVAHWFPTSWALILPNLKSECRFGVKLVQIYTAGKPIYTGDSGRFRVLSFKCGQVGAATNHLEGSGRAVKLVLRY
jgi:hypothetical protein